MLGKDFTNITHIGPQGILSRRIDTPGDGTYNRKVLHEHTHICMCIWRVVVIVT